MLELQSIIMAKVYSVTAERIREYIRTHPGQWIEGIAKGVSISHSAVRYHIFGIIKRGRNYGGYLKEDVTVRTEGNNQKMFLKKVENK